MSFREEDNQKNCPSRGLGLAAAAMGVGVGAALYCFFGKRSENPTPSGSTSQEWHCEAEHSFLEESDSSDSSYTTLSENTTTDSSIVEDNENFCNCSNISSNNESQSDMSVGDSETDSEIDPGSDSETEFEYSYALDDSDSTPLSSSIGSNNESQDLISSLHNIVDNTLSNAMTDLMEWDVTSTLDVPSIDSMPNNRLNNIISRLFSPRRRNRNDTNSASAQVFRERSKTLEQCSICFDIILRDQDSMVLPCTHFFHTSCILPWLQERQTCPNCRNAVD